jgi:hypothetical protein
MVDMALEQALLQVSSVPILIYHCPLRCEIALTMQHITVSSVFKFEASSLIWLTD